MERTLYSLGVPRSFLSRLGLSAGRDVMVRVGFCGSFLLRVRVVLVASASLGDERVLFACASCGCLLDRFVAMATAVSVGASFGFWGSGSVVYWDVGPCAPGMF